jgi:hypothetical protein
MRRVAALASGGCCRGGLPPRTELLLLLLLLVVPVVVLELLIVLLKARIFIPLPLGYVRASWRRSGSCARWLATACVRDQATEWRTAVYKNCLRSLRVVC